MKPFYFFFLFILNSALIRGQHLSLKDLVEYTELSTNKFDNHISKRDFRRDYFSTQERVHSNSYIQKQKKGDSTIRAIALESADGISSIHYQTSSLDERMELLQQLTATGFHSYERDMSVDGEEVVLQQGNLRAYTSMEVKDSIPIYTFIIERKMLPKERDLQFAEDLLTINSHEYLVYVFGESVVKKDVFYYSDTDINKCSVLFPNSNRQVIFIWNDERNYSDAAFILVGGQLQTPKTAQITLSIEHNLWHSKQGIFSGMTLRELQSLNEEPINFYSWGQEQEGMLAPENHGRIDFNRVGVVLSCLNCIDGNYKQASVVSSETQLELDKKIYVSTIIIIPEKEKAATASLRRP